MSTQGKHPTSWSAGCEVYLRARAILKSKLGCVVVIILNGLHMACVGLMPSNRRSVSIYWLLLETVPKDMNIDATTRPHDAARAIY